MTKPLAAHPNGGAAISVRARRRRFDSTLALPANLSSFPAQPMPPHTDYARWFAEQVQPHEPLLRAWLRRRFATLRDIDDLVQETYLRLFRARSAGKIDHPKSYLFATARNAALDRLRRDRIVAFEPLTDSAAPLVLAPAADLRAADSDAELALLTAALRELPARCREVLVLRKHHGLSHEEIAARLGISKNTVNTQITIGMMRCRQYFRAHGFTTGGAP